MKSRLWSNRNRNRIIAEFCSFFSLYKKHPILHLRNRIFSSRRSTIKGSCSSKERLCFSMSNENFARSKTLNVWKNDFISIGIWTQAFESILFNSHENKEKQQQTSLNFGGKWKILTQFRRIKFGVCDRPESRRFLAVKSF